MRLCIKKVFVRSLRQIDVHFMKRLHHKVNIVPIIAKADTLTRPELIRMKARVLYQISRRVVDVVLVGGAVP